MFIDKHLFNETKMNLTVFVSPIPIHTLYFPLIVLRIVVCGCGTGACVTCGSGYHGLTETVSGWTFMAIHTRYK